jgi:hypothetical protein
MTVQYSANPCWHRHLHLHVHVTGFKRTIRLRNERWAHNDYSAVICHEYLIF